MHGPRIEKVNGHYKEITGAPTFGIKNLCRGAPVGQGQERENLACLHSKILDLWRHEKLREDYGTVPTKEKAFGNSEEVVTPLMLDGTYLSRNFATLGPLT